MRKSLFTISAILIFFSALSQEQLHSKKKKAIADYNQAKELISIQQFSNALPLLQAAVDRDDSFDEAIVMLGQLYLQMGQIVNAQNLLSNSKTELERTYVDRMLFDLTAAYSNRGAYDLANDFFNQIEGLPFNKSQAELDFRRASLKLVLASQNEAIAEAELLGPALNGFDMQYFPSIDLGGTLVFTARDKQWGGHEQIMYSKEVDDAWTEPLPLSENINSHLNEGTATVSADGLTLVFTGCNRSKGFGSCDLYISTKHNGQWQKPELLPAEVNSRYWDSQPSLSTRGDVLYFVSTRPGLGGQDIYVANKVDGHWTQAQNLGQAINTAQDDAAPFIFADDQTLFFASNGRPGFGGLDIYRTQMTENKWSAPTNLGQAINNHLDQVGYAIASNGWAYYSNADALGKVSLKRVEVPKAFVPEIKMKRLIVEVLDAETKERVEAIVNTSDAMQNLVFNQLALGLYQALVSELPNHLTIQAEGFQTLNNYQLNSHNIQVLLKKKTELKFAPLYFSTNDFRLTEEQLSLLKKVASFLDENPRSKLLLTGYTDSVGSLENNQRLAQQRVEAVRSKLLAFGVTIEAIEIVILGETEAIKQLGDDLDLKSFRRVNIEVKGGF